ncbi:MAG: energy-coupling factor ABC transporter substrate-binding protein [Nitrososphaerota archaeon]|jgi:cobalt transport protein|nr:energy-coupling factor ABC transporter substrate-binding protein [Nitrososphaerota archaeon]
MEYKYYLALAIITPLALFTYIIALGYTPLAEEFISLPDETEILLFSIQAGIMAATLGHFIGTRKGLKKVRATGKAIISQKQQVKMKYLYIAIIGIVIIIFIMPYMIHPGADFSGTDGQGPDEIMSDGYTPWIDPIGYEPGELGERVIFSAQVAIGAAILGCFVGYIRAAPEDKIKPLQ